MAPVELLELAAGLAAHCGHRGDELKLLEALARRRPEDSQVALRRVSALRSQGRWQEAVEVVTAQLQRHPQHVVLWSTLCSLYGARGDHAAAEAAAQEALRVAPDHPGVRAQLALLWARTGRVRDAEGLLDLLKDRSDLPVKAVAEMSKAWSTLGRADEAIDVLERGVAQNPQALALRLSLATLLERSRRPEEARTHAERVLASFPDLVSARRLLMRLDHQAGDLTSARDRGRSLLKRPLGRHVRRSTLLELARIHERLGEEAAAFAAATEGGELDLAEWRAAGQDLDRFPRQVASILRWRKTAPRAPVLPPEERAPPIFIVAFPRSGTTLMEQILQSHPAVQTLDEEPIVDEALRDLGGGSVPDRIDRMSPAEWVRLRARYWHHVDARGLPPHDRVVDKLPLNLVRIDLLARLFPKAHFLVMLRDPRDCVLSAFMQDFALSDSMVQCADLRRCAASYVAVMSVWLEARSDLALRAREQRYEALVMNPESQIRETIAFLDLPWTEAVMRYRGGAGKRQISTPSYMDVARPLFRRASGRWRRYQDHMAPVLSTLEPLALALDYPSSNEQGQR